MKTYLGREFRPRYKDGRIEIDKCTFERRRFGIDYSEKKHTFVCAKSGSGKSYAIRVMIEEISKNQNNQYGTLVIDPIGIYSTLRIANDGQEVETWNKNIQNDIHPRSFENVQVWIPESMKDEYETSMYDWRFSLKIRDISYFTFCFAFDLSVLEPQTSLFRRAQRIMRDDNKDYTIDDLTSFISANAEDSHFRSSTIEALLSKINTLNDLGIISDTGISINELIRRNQTTIIDLSMSNVFINRLIVNFLAERILQRRKQIVRKLLKAKEEQRKEFIPDYIPATQMIIDEAHNFLVNSQSIRRLVKEGRNVGVVLTALSQSPDLDKNLFANINHLFVGQQNWDDNIDKIRRILPVTTKPSELKAKIKALPVGCFYYYDIQGREEKLIRIRPAETLHPASTKLEDESRWLVNDVDDDLYKTVEKYRRELNQFGGKDID